MENIESNDYVGLLSGDSIKVKHPLDQGRVVTLYRVIALKTFRIKKFAITIKKYDSGGWAESINNFDNEPCWVKDNARIFDDAVITNNSIISDFALVFGNAVIDGSRVENYSRVYGNTIINDSLLKDFSEVKDNSKIIGSKLFNGVKIEKNSQIRMCTMKNGSFCTEDAVLNNCELTGAPIVRGTANLTNCKLQNHALVTEGTYKNKLLDRVHDLKMKKIDPDQDPYPSDKYGKGSQIIKNHNASPDPGNFNAMEHFNRLKNS